MFASIRCYSLLFAFIMLSSLIFCSLLFSSLLSSPLLFIPEDFQQSASGKSTQLHTRPNRQARGSREPTRAKSAPIHEGGFPTIATTWESQSRRPALSPGTTTRACNHKQAAAREPHQRMTRGVSQQRSDPRGLALATPRGPNAKRPTANHQAQVATPKPCRKEPPMWG